MSKARISVPDSESLDQRWIAPKAVIPPQDLHDNYYYITQLLNDTA